MSVQSLYCKVPNSDGSATSLLKVKSLQLLRNLVKVLAGSISTYYVVYIMESNKVSFYFKCTSKIKNKHFEVFLDL